MPNCMQISAKRWNGPGHFGATNSAQDISAQVKLGAGQTRRRSNSEQVKLGAEKK